MGKSKRLLLVLASLIALSAMVLARPPKEDLHQLVATGARLLDVRTREEFAAGHLRGALNIPVVELGDRLAEVGPRDQPVVVYCASGVRSAHAADLLKRAGFARVYDLGPMSNW